MDATARASLTDTVNRAERGDQAAIQALAELVVSGAAAASPGKRVTASELNRILLARLVTPARDRSSVTVSRNAKMQYQFEVSIYAGDFGADTAGDAAALAEKLTDQLAEKYPPPAEPTP